MADRPPAPDPGDARERDPAPGEAGEDAATPRWVVAFGIVGVVLILVFVAVHLAGGGFRGHG
jgi:hypothetical protein